MRSCKDCGAYISEEEYDTYQGYCVSCLQKVAKQMATTDRPSSIPYTTCNYCSNSAVIKCSVCGKPLCPSHIMVRKTNPDPRFGKCRDCAHQTYQTQRSDASTVRCILRIILLIIILVVSGILAF